MLKPEKIVAQYLFDHLLNIHGMRKGIAHIYVFKNIFVLIEPQPGGRAPGIIIEPYPVHIPVFNNRGFAFNMPVFGQGHTKNIDPFFLKYSHSRLSPRTTV